MIQGITPVASTDGPRRFTARPFRGQEGDYKEYVGKDGIPRTETTWVHPPVLETGAWATGQTAPFHFGSGNPETDGLEYDLPTRRLSGSTLRETEQHNLSHTNDIPHTKGDLSRGKREKFGAGPPAVPAHRELVIRV